MPKRTKSSARWLAEHASDEFVKRAQREGWRSRAVFKLAQIQETERLLRAGIRCVDLGAAPVAWWRQTFLPWTPYRALISCRAIFARPRCSSKFYNPSARTKWTLFYR